MCVRACVCQGRIACVFVRVRASFYLCVCVEGGFAYAKGALCVRVCACVCLYDKEGIVS